MLPKQIKNLADALAKLPEIGPRAALRLVFYLLSQEQKELENFAQSIRELKAVKCCPQCFNLSVDGLCAICRDPRRAKNQILVVETILDILPIERTKHYRGLYHILGGVLSPLEGVGPEKLKIRELVARIERLLKENKNQTLEIILALNPTTEGDATALYLERQIKPLNTKITRLGRGLSTSSSLEYSDEATIAEALRHRQ